MEERTKIHVGLDVHKDSISVAAAEPGRAPARLIGKLTHDLNKMVKVLAKIGKAEQLHIVYEAGPTGFGLQRAQTFPELDRELPSTPLTKDRYTRHDAFCLGPGNGVLNQA
jgi:hypothetical protein